MTDELELPKRQKLKAIDEARREAHENIKKINAQKAQMSDEEAVVVHQVAHARVMDYYYELEPLLLEREAERRRSGSRSGGDQTPASVWDGRPLGSWTAGERETTVVGLKDFITLDPVRTTSSAQKRSGFLGTRVEHDVEKHPIPLHLLEGALRLMNEFLQREGLMLERDDELPADELAL